MSKRISKVLAFILAFCLSVSSFNIPSVRAQEILASQSPVSYQIDGYWDSGFNATINVCNTTSNELHNWKLAFHSDAVISNIWNASIISSEDGNYVVEGVDWNSIIKPGETVSFGFTASGDYTATPSGWELTDESSYVSDEGVRVTYELSNDWGSGFTSRILLHNESSQKVKGWNVEFDFNRKIDQLWNGNLKDTGINHFSVSSTDYNNIINPGETIEIGFIGHDGNTDDLPCNIIFMTRGKSSGTVVPVVTPTAEPTDIPTVIPTEEPTVAPTEEPAIVPTAEPTETPTKEPTAVPTAEPTVAPMEEPTAVPTAEPTVAPTEEPTAVPTAEPTVVPTEEPTKIPSSTPTPAIEPDEFVDTDGDGASDAWEIANGYDPKTPNDKFIVKNTTETGFLRYEIELAVKGNQIATFGAEPVTDHYLLKDTTPGYMGSAIDYSLNGTFESAKVTIYFDESYIGTPDFKPTLFYVNEEKGCLEAVPTEWDGKSNHVTAYLQHFSTYVLFSFDQLLNLIDYYMQNFYNLYYGSLYEKLKKYYDYSKEELVSAGYYDHYDGAITINNVTVYCHSNSYDVYQESIHDDSFYEYLKRNIGQGSSTPISINCYRTGCLYDYKYQPFAFYVRTGFDDNPRERFEQDSAKDSNNDGINDAYTELLCSGELTDGAGNKINIGITYNDLQADTDGDWDNDGIKNGDEYVIIERVEKSGWTEWNGKSVYVKINSDMMEADSDGDGIYDNKDPYPLNDFRIIDKINNIPYDGYELTDKCYIPYNSKIDGAAKVTSNDYLNSMFLYWKKQYLNPDHDVISSKSTELVGLAAGAYNNIGGVIWNHEVYGMAFANIKHYFASDSNPGGYLEHNGDGIIFCNDGINAMMISDANVLMKLFENSLLPNEELFLTLRDSNEGVNRHIMADSGISILLGDSSALEELLAFNEASFGSTASCKLDDNGEYTMELYSCIQDYYDFYYGQDTDRLGLKIGLGIDQGDAGFMALTGNAYPYEVSAISKIEIKWKKGQSYNEANVNKCSYEPYTLARKNPTPKANIKILLSDYFDAIEANVDKIYKKIITNENLSDEERMEKALKKIQKKREKYVEECNLHTSLR